MILLSCEFVHAPACFLTELETSLIMHACMQPYTILVYGDDCIYPQNPALGLGVCAAIFLLVAQVTFSSVGGCCGCCKARSIPSETKRIVGVVCAVFSW
jgi:hypothetical protein